MFKVGMVRGAGVGVGMLRGAGVGFGKNVPPDTSVWCRGGGRYVEGC